jgi:hypothetical protein
MTKKHFIAIAKILRTRIIDAAGESNACTRITARYLAGDLADYFETVNDLFDREKFLRACGA